MTAYDLAQDLSGLSAADWLAALETLGESTGHFEHLGAAHANLFIDQDRTLLVTFETIDEARARPGARPRALDLAQARGWSALALFSEGRTWFRDPAVWGTFDRLSDDGFFDDFERVLFFGAESCGYAAASLSVAAPGARVLAIAPQATLTPSLTRWDRRFPEAAALDFTSRYGYGPDMIDAAAEAHIILDPAVQNDLIHAALYLRRNVHLHRAAGAGVRCRDLLDQLGLIEPLIEQAMDGALDSAAFGRLWRARRQNPRYLRSLAKRLENANRHGLLHRLYRFGASTPDSRYFEARLNDFIATTAAAQ